MTAWPASAVTVMGAGAVGCLVGGRLQAAGARVHFVGRPRVLDALRTQGLRLTDLDDGDIRLPPSELSLHDAPPTDAGLVLMCVKTADTANAAAQLAAWASVGTPVLSLQNGVVNTDTGSNAAPSLIWLPGVVPFNVVEAAPGHYHRATSGQLAAQRHETLDPWLPLFAAAGLPLQVHDDIRPVQWGKLLLNLNNPVNALSGLPLKAQLLDRDYRLVLAALQAEALAVLHAAQIKPAAMTAVSPDKLVQVLRLPTWIFRRVAKPLLRMDEQARSSMADDIARGKPTEVDAFCGAVVRLARRRGMAAPLNTEMVTLLSAPQPQTMSGAALRQRLGL